MGLALAILKQERYRELSARFRDAGFKPDTNARGNPTSQRWRIKDTTVDILIPPSDKTDKVSTSRIQNIESDFAAIITPGLELAFQDRRKSRFQTSLSLVSAREGMYGYADRVLSCVLKALAVKHRGENKDAYDLMYVLNGIGTEETARCLRQFLSAPIVQEALEIIREDFTAHDGIGPMRVAESSGLASRMTTSKPMWWASRSNFWTE